MDERIVLIDNDIFIVLAGADLLSDALKLLGFQMQYTYRLGTLPHMLMGKKLRSVYTEDVLNKAMEWTDKIAPITDEPIDDEPADRMVAVKDDRGVSPIQPTDALLFSLVMENPNYYLATGDKKALIALAQNQILGDISAAVSGRIICLEVVIRSLIQNQGCHTVATAFNPLMSCHKTIGIVFSQPAHSLVASESYLNDLVKVVGKGFLLTP